MFTILGLRLIPNIDGGEVDPTPTAAPVELIIGALGAEYLKPIAMIPFSLVPYCDVDLFL